MSISLPGGGYSRAVGPYENACKAANNPSIAASRNRMFYFPPRSCRCPGPENWSGCTIEANETLTKPHRGRNRANLALYGHVTYHENPKENPRATSHSEVMARDGPRRHG